MNFRPVINLFLLVILSFLKISLASDKPVNSSHTDWSVKSPEEAVRRVLEYIGLDSAGNAATMAKALDIADLIALKQIPDSLWKNVDDSGFWLIRFDSIHIRRGLSGDIDTAAQFRRRFFALVEPVRGKLALIFAMPKEHDKRIPSGAELCDYIEETVNKLMVGGYLPDKLPNHGFLYVIRHAIFPRGRARDIVVQYLVGQGQARPVWYITNSDGIGSRYHGQVTEDPYGQTAVDDSTGRPKFVRSGSTP